MALECLVTTGGADEDAALDAGILAESLVFYQSVQVLAGIRLIQDLVKMVGPWNLVALMDRGSLHVTYLDNLTVCHTRTDGVIDYHQPTIITAKKFALQSVLNDALRGRKKAERERWHRELMDRILASRHDEVVTTHAREWLNKPDWAQRCMRQLLAEYGAAPDLIGRTQFRLAQHGSEFTIDTNLDFELVNRVRSPALPPLSNARLIAHVTTACGELVVASRARADIHTHPHTSSIVGTMLESTVRHRVENAVQIEAFQRLTLNDGNAIAESINAGSRDFSDVVALLARADKFRGWLAERAPSADLLSSYYDATTKDSWVSSLPAKTFRWLVPTFSGAVVAGAPGALVGAGLSALDVFLVERLATGWRPNQFVDGPLRAFVRKPR